MAQQLRKVDNQAIDLSESIFLPGSLMALKALKLDFFTDIVTFVRSCLITALAEGFRNSAVVFDEELLGLFGLQTNLCRRSSHDGSGVPGVPDHSDVFLSYSRNDGEAAINLRGQLQRCGLYVFKDDERIRAGELWLDRLQDAVGGCGSFIVLVGRDGVRRWIGAETQAALSRHFAPHDDAERLPIFPILLEGTDPETLPAFLRLFQMTPWNGADALPQPLLDQIRERTIVANKQAKFEGCPFVGLAAYSMDEAQLFFGRQKETLDALACFFDIRSGSPTVRWLEINGHSGSGKSSLMQAGLLPLIDQGWLWRPRSGYERWMLIGPMMPGDHPLRMLAQELARAFHVERADVRRRLLADDDDLALSDWLSSRIPDRQTAFLLAIDQFEELFTFADPEERRRFDRLLAAALEDADCPLFVISTVRADFLDRFAEDLPQLVAVRNRRSRPWTLTPIGDPALRDIIEEPARLARLDVSEVKEAMVAEARGEPGALPLVENALHWLWQHRSANRLSGRLFNEQGGLAGILSHSADHLLSDLGTDQRDRALEVLFQLVRVDRDGSRHTRRRMPFDEAVDVAGSGEAGRALVNRLAGERTRDRGSAEGPLRLITITEEGARGATAVGDGRWVNLIHETLIRSKGLDAAGKPQPYWPTLWSYIEQHKERAAWRERLQADTQIWIENGRRGSDLWSHERVREAVAALTRVGPELQLSSEEREFLGPINPDVMLAELKKPETPHKRRFLIGERLDVVGDPRPGVGVDADGTPQIGWCSVRGGDVTISILSDPDNQYSEVKDTRRKIVGILHIARYPITVTQYRCFLGAEDGWCDPAWWGDDLYRDPEGNAYEFGRFGNHPAAHVSWFDAVAFCRWLSRRLDFTVRLPDEWEWQQAATSGDDKNVFPWGADWNAKQEPYRANTLESRLSSVTAVGMYPAGTSPTGALDMGGTVWEWCLNKFDPPEVTDFGARDFDFRVLRGGSWDLTQVYARSAHRIRNNPRIRYHNFGLRVVCSSPSSSSDH